MNNQEIVAKLWNLCNVLRDDGITYHQYVTELTYILFLKMCKETGTEGAIPEQYRWDKLLAKQGNICERDMFNTFNMGVGMSIVVAKADADKALEVLKAQGEEPYIIGEIIKSDDKVIL